MSAPPPDKPLRADAHRNRARILAAAGKVFATGGASVPIEEIARRSKVGIGTFYRHFPSREALLEELVREFFSAQLEVARQGLESDDAWEGFSTAMWELAKLTNANLGACEIMANASRDQRIDVGRIAMETGLAELTGELIARAQAQGTMRADASFRDIGLMMAGAGAVMQYKAQYEGPEEWRRYITVMLDGLRARE